jgi:hypothetical protein
MSIVADFCPADLSNQPIGRTGSKKKRIRNGRSRFARFVDRTFAGKADRKDLSVAEINELLIAAECADQEQGESLTLLDYRGFGPYNSNELISSFSLLQDKALPGDEIVLRCGAIYLEKGEGKASLTDDRGVIRAKTWKPLLSEDREQRFQELSEVASSRTHKQALTLMGLINHVLHHAADSFGVIEWAKGFEGCRRIERIDREGAQLLVKTEWKLWCSVSSAASAIAEHWSGVAAPSSRQSVKRAAAWLKENGFLDYEHDEFVPGVWGKSRRYHSVDVQGCLMLFNVLEGEIGGYEELPTHHGSLIKHLWNQVFNGWGYRRKGEPDTKEPDDLDQTLAWRERRSKPVDWGAESLRTSVLTALDELIERWRSLRSALGMGTPEEIAAKAEWQQFQAENRGILGW